MGYSVLYHAEQVLDLSNSIAKPSSIGNLVSQSLELGKAVLRGSPTDGERADAEQVVATLGARSYTVGELAGALELAIELARSAYGEVA